MAKEFVKGVTVGEATAEENTQLNIYEIINEHQWSG